eukprot:947057-Prorocentrum_minimum.AAC.1
MCIRDSHSVVQGVQQVPGPTQGVGARGAGVQGAPHLLHQEAQGAQQGEAGGRRLHLDRAPLQAPQGNAPTTPPQHPCNTPVTPPQHPRNAPVTVPLSKGLTGRSRPL